MALKDLMSLVSTGDNIQTYLQNFYAAIILITLNFISINAYFCVR